MHIPDGMLDAKTLAGGWAATLPAVGWAARRVGRAAGDARIVLMSVLAALIFALQMLNFPVAGGTSGHFAGGALAAILLGPWPAVLVLTAVLAVQALVFADGGITALGANVVDMAIVAPFVGWWFYSAAVRMSGSRTGRIAGAFAAGWFACVASALGAALMLWSSGAAPLVPVLSAMGFWHALIGIGEGLVTAGIVAYVHAVRPELMRPDADLMRPRGIAISLGILAAVAVGASALASRLPDGLESVASALGLSPGHATPGGAPLTGYRVPGVGNEALAGVLAGIAGVIVTGVLVLTALRAIRRRRAGT